jgi:DNA polymerase-3 subunit alpha
MFQFESGGMRDVLMKMRPNRIEDLIAANALYRPGPMINIDAYIARKHGVSWKTPHQIMDEVLEETYGIIVYQEQVARLVNQLGGIERKRAFRLAKAISKKKTAMIEAEREPFVDGAAKNGLQRTVAEEIFNQILPFGEYAFNKAHSTRFTDPNVLTQIKGIDCYACHPGIVTQDRAESGGHPHRDATSAVTAARGPAGAWKCSAANAR